MGTHRMAFRRIFSGATSMLFVFTNGSKWLVFSLPDRDWVCDVNLDIRVMLRFHSLGRGGINGNDKERSACHFKENIVKVNLTFTFGSFVGTANKCVRSRAGFVDLF